MFSNTFIILLLQIYFVSSFGFPGLGKGLRALEKEVNADILDSESAIFKRKWIVQPLDHFDDTEKRTWEMRYFERNDMWKSGGPMYLLIGYGDYRTYLERGIFYDLAKETNGVLFLSEIRYYGQSKPLLNLTTENMIYLSSRQVLADNARLIENIKLNASYRSSKVVILGHHFSGHLAAWMKLKYPSIVDAAIASSAQVLAKVDFYEFFETTNDGYKKYGLPGCIEKIAKRFQRFEDLLKTQEGIAELKKEEHICDFIDFEKQEDREFFFYLNALGVALNCVNGITEGIINYCTQINVSLSSEIARSLVTWNEKQQCWDCRYESNIHTVRSHQEDWVSNYEICAEFGQCQTTNSDKQPFTKNVPLKYYYKLCKDLFGADFDENRMHEGVRKTNAMYGGLHPNVTQVVFVNGELNPWIKLGILKDLSPDAPARVIPRVSIHQFVWAESADDSEDLKETRKYVKNLIKKWIRVGEPRI